MALFSIKRYLPRSLYGRAALILLVPIVTIQLVVSFAFIQRLYEDVTVQMTQNMLPQLQLLLEADNASRVNEARVLQLQVQNPTEPVANRVRFYDLSLIHI